MQPRVHTWDANGLAQNVLEWPAFPGGAGGAGGAEPATRSATGATVVVVHGFQDCAATWEDVTGPLAAAGFRVLAPDMRGFGDTGRAPPGSYYYFPDYVADLAALVRGHLNDAPLFLVGHSMGATIVTYFAGAFPERVTKLAIVDGVGPPDNAPNLAPTRMRRWIESAYEADHDRKPMTRDEALQRLSRFNPLVDQAVLARRVDQLSRPVDGVDGGLVWKGDPLHSTMSPIPFHAASYRSFAERVACPVLYVSGGPSGYHVPDEDERLACFPRLSRVTLDGGHSLHWTRPTELARALTAFWGERIDPVLGATEIQGEGR